MSKINNKNLIYLGIGLSAIFVLSFLVFLPISAKADYSSGWQDNTNAGYQNPAPFVSSISPNSANKDVNATITIYGNNFMQGSVVRWNGYDRPTTYIDPGTLRVQLNFTYLNNGGSYPITVINPAPGGGSSNQIMFTVNNVVYTTTNVTKVNTSVVNRTITNTNTNTKNNTSNNEKGRRSFLKVKSRITGIINENKHGIIIFSFPPFFINFYIFWLRGCWGLIEF